MTRQLKELSTCAWVIIFTSKPMESLLCSQLFIEGYGFSTAYLSTINGQVTFWEQFILLLLLSGLIDDTP
jgi:hypothetical protein